jgi:transcriptional regulator with XRE-family HTH domain
MEGTMGKKYSSVLEMLKGTGNNKRTITAVEKLIKERSLVTQLIILRCRHNMTQKELAAKIGCTQSRVSKIESSLNREIVVADLLDYAKALNLRLEIGYRHPSVKLVDLIRYHALKIKEYLSELRTLAKDDAVIKKGVCDFHKEAQNNLNRFINDSLNKLDDKQMGPRSDYKTIHISAPLESSEFVLSKK